MGSRVTKGGASATPTPDELDRAASDLADLLNAMLHQYKWEQVPKKRRGYHVQTTRRPNGQGPSKT